MRLIPAPGSQEMQLALASPYVHKIVDIMLRVRGKDFFSLMATFLKDHEQQTAPYFELKLQALRVNQRRRRNAEGDYEIPPYIEEAISTLKALYGQDERKVAFQRGAIVELLASKLVSSHCGINECYSNHRFIDGRYASDQVDVAVLSDIRQQIEGYSCKIKRMSIMSEDCTNLTSLARKAEELYYKVHIGTICFEHSSLIEQRLQDRLRDIPFSTPIKAYGLDNFLELEKPPFIR